MQTPEEICQEPLTSMKKKKLIFDVNTAVDDAQALMLALASPSVEVLGIICSYGSTPLENALKNTLCVLKVCKKLEIPVYQGCSKPLLAKKCQAEDLLEKDALSDVSNLESPSLELVQKENGVTALVKLVNQNPGEVSLVATAPLTNLAVAVQLDPSFSKKLKALYIVGGSTDSSTVCEKFNFAADPEAARIVLDCYACPTCIAPLELSCSNSLSLSFCEQLLSQTTEKSFFLKKILSLSMKKAQSAAYQKKITAAFSSCDAYAVAAAIEDAFVTESEEAAVTVELQGAFTRGMMVVDCTELLNKKQKASLVKKVDLEKLKTLFLNSIK